MARKLGAQPEAIVGGEFKGRNAEAINKNFETLFRRLRGVSNDGVLHALLSATQHSDVTEATPSNGDLIVRQGGAWARLAVGAADTVLRVSSSLPAWSKIVNAMVDAAAAIDWTKISKTGSSLADLATRSASDLSSGTLPDGRFPATLPAVSGANLTNLDASDLATGTVPDARLSSNVALEDAANTFTAKQTISSTNPLLVLNDTSEAADQKKVRLSLDAGILKFESADDAETIFGDLFTMNRATGEVTFNSLSFNIVASIMRLKPAVSTVANLGTLSLGTTAVQGFLFVLDTTNGNYAIFTLRGGVASTQEVSDPSGVFSITAGTGGGTNIYYSGGNSRYELENRTGGSVDYRLLVIGL